MRNIDRGEAGLMNATSKGTWLAVLIAATAVLGLTAVAQAHKKLYKSTVSIVLTKAAEDDFASGRVDAHKESCRSGRTVVLFQEGKGGVTGQFIEIGRTKSDSEGKWTVPIQNGIKKGLAYHAQAKAEKIRNNGGHKHICKSKFSPDVPGT
jgi:hypothetical protein